MGIAKLQTRSTIISRLLPASSQRWGLMSFQTSRSTLLSRGARRDRLESFVSTLRLLPGAVQRPPYAAERDFLAPLQHSHLAAASTLSPDCHYFIGAKPCAPASGIVMSRDELSRSDDSRDL